MKRILLLVLAFTAAIGSLSAQNYIVVNLSLIHISEPTRPY